MPQVLNPQRLAAVLERMSSPHDGEAASAARMAHKMVRDAGLTFADVIGTGAPRKGSGAFAVDRPIEVNGVWLHPPHERSWTATTLFLIRQATSPTARMSEADRSWLLRQAAIWRTRSMRPWEAQRVVEIHERLTAPSKGQA